jgi:hypothetical protein
MSTKARRQSATTTPAVPPAPEPPTTKRSRNQNAFWTSEDDNLLVEVLLEAKGEGQGIEGGFKEHVYANAAKRLESTWSKGAEKSATNCKTRLATVSS